MAWFDLILIAAVSVAFLYVAYRGVRRWRADRRRRMDRVLESAREELSSERLEERLMAVFTLEETAKQSVAGYREAAQILSGFLRRKGCRCPGGRNGSISSASAGARAPGPDVQRALTVLARCRPVADDAADGEAMPLDLAGAGLCRAGLPAARLDGIRLRGVCLLEAELWKVDLRNAELSDARLAGANLSGAKLDGATVAGADLSGTNLEYAAARDADLSGADLTRADLTFAHLEGADLTGTTGLTDAQIESAYTDARTVLPAHLARGERSNEPGPRRSPC